MARAAKTRVRSARVGSTGREKTAGRLVLAALLSWGVYVAADRFTVAPDALAMWLSGAAAALTLTVRAGRR